MDKQQIVNMGIGFVTGRKNFRQVLKTYIYRWQQTSAAIKDRINLHLFIAYDLEYNNTSIDDYENIRPELLDIVDSVFFISQSMLKNEVCLLDEQKIVKKKESEVVFGRGYAGNRNAILYFALKRGMDCLIFLDDDEYPLAVSKTGNGTTWNGQDIFATHLKYLEEADITNGLHCGYISPIPHIDFGGIVAEADFRLFIEAISNDILEWDNIKRLIDDGGVTYADPQFFIKNTAREVEEVRSTKFISGSNLGINLKKPQRVKPFFNPPKARGEDTFLSTCLTEHKVLRVPCYTFHDGFSTYKHLLDGVLPLHLKHINANNESIVTRFYRACVGWLRYKPLYLFITQPENFVAETQSVKSKLLATIPKLCEYFDDARFQKLPLEFEKYCCLAEEHHKLFLENQRIWEPIRDYAAQYTHSPPYV